jgi:hypothetical protein
MDYLKLFLILFIVSIFLYGCSSQKSFEFSSDIPNGSQNIHITEEAAAITDDTNSRTESTSNGISGRVNKVVFNSKNNMIAMAIGSDLRIQEIYGDKSYEIFPSNFFPDCYFNPNNYIFWFPNSRTFLTEIKCSSSASDIALLDLVNYEIVHGPSIIHDWDAEVTHSGILLAKRDMHGGFYVTLYEKNTFEEIEIIYSQDFDEVGGDLDLSPDGSKIIFLKYVIDLNNKIQIAELNHSCGTASSSDFNWSPDGRYIYSISDHPEGEDYHPACFWLYDVENNFEPRNLTDSIYPNYIYNSDRNYYEIVAFSHTSDRFASVHLEYFREDPQEFSNFVTKCNVKIYNAKNLSLLQDISLESTTDYLWNYIEDVIWSYDGNYLAIPFEGVKILDVNNGNLILDLPFSW